MGCCCQADGAAPGFLSQSLSGSPEDDLEDPSVGEQVVADQFPADHHLTDETGALKGAEDVFDGTPPFPRCSRRVSGD